MVTFSLKRAVMFLGLLSIGSSAVHAAMYSVEDVASIFAADSLGGTKRLAYVEAKKCFNSLNTHLNAFASRTPKRRGSITRQNFKNLQKFMQTQPQATLATFQDLRNTYDTKFSAALAEYKDLTAVIANFDAKLAQVIGQMHYASTESILSPGLVRTKKTRARRQSLDMAPVRLDFDVVMDDELIGLDLKHVEQENTYVPVCGPVQHNEQEVVKMDVEMVQEVAPVTQPALLSREYIINVVMKSEAWAKQVWLIAPSNRQISQWWAKQQAAK